MDELYKYLEGKPNFSGNVLVSKGPDIIFKESFGFSDQENKVKNDLQTRFLIGSVTKPVVAVGVLQLVEQGKLRLDQPVTEFIPSIYPDSNITIHHLLTHTSGVPNYIQFKQELPWAEEHSPQKILQETLKKNQRFTPGKKWEYSNTNYLILGLVIEILSETDLYSYLRTAVFNPAGMKDTGFEIDNMDNVAKNYIDGNKGIEMSSSFPFGCGDMVSTVEDLLLFERGLFNGSLLSQETVKLMISPRYKSMAMCFGYGWVVNNLFKRPCIGHSGSHPKGYTAHLEKYLDDDITIIVVSNNMVKFSPLSLKDTGATFINRELAQVIFGQKLGFWRKYF